MGSSPCSNRLYLGALFSYQQKFMDKFIRVFNRRNIDAAVYDILLFD